MVLRIRSTCCCSRTGPPPSDAPTTISGQTNAKWCPTLSISCYVSFLMQLAAAKRAEASSGIPAGAASIIRPYCAVHALKRAAIEKRTSRAGMRAASVHVSGLKSLIRSKIARASSWPAPVLHSPRTNALHS
ncbi:hypothetical protein PWT90_09598 [Aphanocladium album]|nr:hypothetical protein PWT90_09598 [Aphanocladium album]